MIEGFGYAKKVVGHYTRLQARAWHWLVSLNRALNCRLLHGIEGQRLTGWPATAVSRPARPHARLRRPRHPPGLHQLQQSQGQHRDSERFLRTLKEELVLPREWTSPTAFHHWLADYNATSLHSALSYRAPNVVEAEHLGHASLP